METTSVCRPFFGMEMSPGISPLWSLPGTPLAGAGVVLTPQEEVAPTEAAAVVDN